MGAPVEQTTVPNEETLTENVGNENDAIDNQQDPQPNPTVKAEKSPESTDENHVTTFSEDNDEFQKEKPTINTRGENYNLRPNPNPNFSDLYQF